MSYWSILRSLWAKDSLVCIQQAVLLHTSKGSCCLCHLSVFLFAFQASYPTDCFSSLSKKPEIWYFCSCIFSAPKVSFSLLLLATPDRQTFHASTAVTLFQLITYITEQCISFWNISWTLPLNLICSLTPVKSWSPLDLFKHRVEEWAAILSQVRCWVSKPKHPSSEVFGHEKESSTLWKIDIKYSLLSKVNVVHSSMYHKTW